MVVVLTCIHWNHDAASPGRCDSPQQSVLEGGARSIHGRDKHLSIFIQCDITEDPASEYVQYVYLKG